MIRYFYNERKEGKEMNDFAAINEVYAKYFTEPYPSRSCVEVARLPKDVMLEIEVIALAK